MNIKLYFKMFIAFILSIFTAIGGLFMPTEPSNVCMIAHRGYSSKYLQNTELAFTQAAKHGSGGAETDIRVTSDGVYVKSHDAEAVFEDGTEMQIAEHTFAELTAQPLKNKKTRDKVYLCTLKRYLEIMKENNIVAYVCLSECKSTLPFTE